MLLGNLELTGFNQFAGLVAELVNVNAASVVGEVQRCFLGKVGGLIHLPAKEIEDLYGVAFIVILLEIEIDNRCSRVGVEQHNRASCTGTALNPVLGVGEERCADYKRQY